MGLNWNFQSGGRIQTKKTSVGEVWVFSETTQLEFEVVLCAIQILLYMYICMAPLKYR